MHGYCSPGACGGNWDSVVLSDLLKIFLRYCEFRMEKSVIKFWRWERRMFKTKLFTTNAIMRIISSLLKLWGGESFI